MRACSVAYRRAYVNAATTWLALLGQARASSQRAGGSRCAVALKTRSTPVERVSPASSSQSTTQMLAGSSHMRRAPAAGSSSAAQTSALIGPTWLASSTVSPRWRRGSASRGCRWPHRGERARSASERRSCLCRFLNKQAAHDVAVAGAERPRAQVALLNAPQRQDGGADLWWMQRRAELGVRRKSCNRAA